jgi:Dihaem cytochrome c
MEIPTHKSAAANRIAASTLRRLIQIKTGVIGTQFPNGRMAGTSSPCGSRPRVLTSAFAGIFLLALLGAGVAVTLSAATAKAQSSGVTQFAAGSIPLLADAQRDPLGSVTPGTPLSVIKRAGDLAEVRIDGWSMAGADTVVFAAKGQRIVLAELSANRPANRTVGTRSEDQYGGVWEQVTVTGWVSSSDLVAAVEPVWEKAHALFAKRCTMCHALHQPTEFTANQWPHILQIMTKRAVLTPDQTALVTKYLQTHARQPGAPAAGPKGPGPRR